MPKAISMGLLDRLLGKKQEKKPAPELGIGELESWIAQRIEEKKKEVVEDLSHEVDEILKARDMVSDIVEELGEYEFPPEVKKKVYKPVLTSKPAYVKGMADALQSIGPVNPETYEDLRNFYTATKKAMKTVEKVQLGKGRYLMVTFREYMLKIGGALNTILDALKSMRDELREAEKEIGELQGLVAEVNELRKKQETVSSPPEGEGIEELRKKRLRLEEELRRFLDGAEYKSYIDLEKTLKDLREQESDLRMKVINIIGPFRRSFRKLRKLMEKDEAINKYRKALDKYLDAPFEAFAAEDESCSRIDGILRSLGRAIEEGTLKLGRKERRKVMSKVNVDLDVLRKLRSRLYSLRKEAADVEAEIRRSRIPEVRKSMERELAEVEAELRRMEEEWKSRVEEVERLKKEIPAVMKKLEEKIEKLTGEKVRLRRPAVEG